MVVVGQPARDLQELPLRIQRNCIQCGEHISTWLGEQPVTPLCPKLLVNHWKQKGKLLLEYLTTLPGAKGWLVAVGEA